MGRTEHGKLPYMCSVVLSWMYGIEFSKNVRLLLNANWLTLCFASVSYKATLSCILMQFSVPSDPLEVSMKTVVFIL